MLEDNSADVPPTPALAEAAEAAGRRTRRRRYVVGGLSTAAALAVGFTVIPTLFTDAAPPTKDPALASTLTPTVRPDVDLALLTKGGLPFLQLGDWTTASIGELKELTSVVVSTTDGSVVRPYFGGGTALTGSVLGVTELPVGVKGPVAKKNGKGMHGLGLRIKVDRTLADASPLTTDPSGEVLLDLGVVNDDGIKLATQAIPVGARLVAVAGPSADPDPDAHTARTVIFEDADGSPAGGPYSLPKRPSPWSDAKSFDEVVALVDKAYRDCPTLDLSKKTDPRDRKVIAVRIKEMAKILADRPLCAIVFSTYPHLILPPDQPPVTGWTEPKATPTP
ncbi:hypothetical protein [Actinocorallia lasiicapitis]